jgi:hypothetical protein
MFSVEMSPLEGSGFCDTGLPARAALSHLWWSGGCIAAHLANLYAAEFARRDGSGFIATRYAESVCAAGERARRLVGEADLELTVFFAFDDVERAVAL